MYNKRKIPSKRVPHRLRLRTRSFVFAVVLSLAGAVTGCDQIAEKEAEPQTPAALPDTKTPPSDSKAERKQITDHDIERAIVHQLFVEGIFPTTLVNVSVENGIAKISGSAFSLFAKNQAEEIVRSIKGVRGFIDELDVVATDISDADLASNIEQALLFDPATEAYEVDVAVKDGVVTLTGEVDSWTERQLAVEVAASVMGTVGVENELSMKAPPVRPNQEIQAEVKEILKNDVRVDSALVDVEVAGGIVTLKGLVGSEAEKRHAISRAWVIGVSRVDADDLNVEWWERERFVAQRPAAPRPDAEVADAVKDALRYDARVNDDDIELFVDGGKVTLTGEVPSLQSKNLAADTAQNILGVTRVRNYLMVDPLNDVDDDILKERVLRALRFNPYLHNWEGTVNAKNGLITLEGTVNTAAQKRRAEGVASRVMGVIQVENQIDVYLQEMQDLTLIEDVEEALRWNVFVDASDIRVAADNGKVTLTGEVHDLREYREAVDAARGAGAEVVYNRLDIEKAG